ncbi:hypothetical protein CC1G_11861 [Coprinopsis cinerea okayama7|uniref:Uncharacterized protein n=1 Tax=Coprinopsis cinerea (strain Okayama-7 / 130 / ATCC MYA-4618 / FGSC 9003) TaxID=240176 RepID=A8PH35_COPC7|nr:hypothetical protein CC1G_11861 [Coprinopsis cinerea okayama7\|eukprot:XP_001841333.2 hypothetical protein CC1G_11861 [Coprinopsis cinerea okayama7\
MSPTNPARPSHADFTLPDFTWLRTEMSAEQKDELVQLINHYPVVVDDPARDGAWVSYSVEYHGARRSQNAPSWMTNKYDLWFRHPLVILEKQLACPDFDGSMDFVPFRESTPDGKRLYTDFMSANWAWDQADVLSRNPKFKGAMFAPVIVGRGESAVSLDSASQNEFYPLYISLGNIQGVVRCSHHDPMSLIGLLAIPKAMVVPTLNHFVPNFSACR